MAKVVLVLSQGPNSIIFQKKCITLSEGEVVTLGRAGKQRPALTTNGLFECTTQTGERCSISKNHAQITCHGTTVFLKCFNKNTFVNGERLAVNVLKPIRDGATVMLGGFLPEDVATVAEGTVTCVASIFEPSSENFKYFLLVEKEFPFYCQWPGPPPSVNIGLERLYSAAVHRFEVLKVLAGLGENELDSFICDKNSEHERLNSFLEELSGKNGDYKKLYAAKQDDVVSQIVLAVAGCRNHRTRNWFITQETKLFKLRWLRMSPAEHLAFLEMLNSQYIEVPVDEVKDLKESYPDFFPAAAKYYKIPFTEVPLFVRHRKVSLIDGLCYVSLQDMYAPLVKRLRSSLWGTAEVLRSNLNKIWYDDRIRSIVHYFEEYVCDPDRYKKPNGRLKEKITERQIYELCDESFPLCMKILHYHLCRDHHLRNGGRFQYTLFLKGIGLSMTGSLSFWKAYFTKKIEETVFMKRYAYHIRHAYGAEGKMADYPPQNCADILKAAPGPLEYHGCPFKVLDETRMKEALFRSGLKKEVYTEIMELVKKGTPQDACKKYFELTQGGSYPHSTVSHPNIYYDESRRLRKLRKDPVTINYEQSIDPAVTPVPQLEPTTVPAVNQVLELEW